MRLATDLLLRLLAWAVVALAYAIVVPAAILFSPILFLSRIINRRLPDLDPPPPPERRRTP